MFETQLVEKPGVPTSTHFEPSNFLTVGLFLLRSSLKITYGLFFESKLKEVSQDALDETPTVPKFCQEVPLKFITIILSVDCSRKTTYGTLLELNFIKVLLILSGEKPALPNVTHFEPLNTIAVALFPFELSLNRTYGVSFWSISIDMYSAHAGEKSALPTTCHEFEAVTIFTPKKIVKTTIHKLAKNFILL